MRAKKSRSRKSKKRKKRISSGDKRTDKFFSRVINALNGDKTWNIYLVVSIRDEKKHKTRPGYLYGVYDNTDDEDNDLMNDIFLAKDRRLHKGSDEIAKTLLHEVLHIMFPKTHEFEIRDLEEYWWEKFSKIQRSILKSYIPQKIVNLKPHL